MPNWFLNCSLTINNSQIKNYVCNVFVDDGSKAQKIIRLNFFWLVLPRRWQGHLILYLLCVVPSDVFPIIVQPWHTCTPWYSWATSHLYLAPSASWRVLLPLHPPPLRPRTSTRHQPRPPPPGESQSLATWKTAALRPRWTRQVCQVSCWATAGFKQPCV